MYARSERFNLAQGFAELAEELADRIAPIMRRQPGLRSITLLEDESSGEYIVLTHWETLEQIQTYEHSADEWRVRDTMSRHITAVPVIEVWQVHALAAATEPVAVGARQADAAAPVAVAPVADAPMVDAAPDAAATGTAPTGAAASSASAERAVAAGVVVFEPRGGGCPADFPIKGHHSRSGEFIYHLPGGQFYDRTVPEVCFASEADAVAAGFRAPRG